MTLFSELNTQMVRHGFRPNRKMGQNFVTDEALVQKLVNLAGLKEKDTVLEIGAGTGFLTRELQRHCKVIAVELDKKLCEVIERELPEKNLELVYGNYLELKLPRCNKIVSLPPYTISTKMIEKILSEKFEKAVMVLQREFAEKLVAEPGFTEYGFISVLTQYHCTPEIVETVSPESFFPKSNSFSAIVKLEYGKRFGSAVDDVLFHKFIKAVFRYSNKNLANSLKCAFPFLKKELGIKKEAFKEKVASLEFRGEKTNTLSCKELVEAFNALFS